MVTLTLPGSLKCRNHSTLQWNRFGSGPRELTGGLGAHSVLECVGHGESMRTAAGIARAGGAVGRVGVPQETTIPDAQPTFYGNITIAGGPAPVRAYMHELMADVLEGRIEPGLVFDRVTNIDGVPDGYPCDERP
jgi:threonine dehydrogenase-like Zn-dependent dehydrogenase